MTIQDNLNRIQQAKSDIKAAIESKGVYVDEADKIDIYASKIYEIEQGDRFNVVDIIDGAHLYNMVMYEGFAGPAVLKGTITGIDNISPEYNNATYYVDDAIKVYRGNYLEGMSFMNGDELKIGDYVVVRGTASNYNGTPQMDKYSVMEVLKHEPLLGHLYADFEDCDGEGNYWRYGFDDGLDGFNYVKINASQYGQDKYNQGFADGQNAGGGIDIDSEGDGTLENPYHVGQARNIGYALEDGGISDYIHVKGYVSNIDYVNEGGTATYDLNNNVGESIKVQDGLWWHGVVPFDGPWDLEVNDIVVLRCQIEKYEPWEGAGWYDVRIAPNSGVEKLERPQVDELILNAEVLDITENGTYYTKYAEIPEWTEPLTGDDFYSYAKVEAIAYKTQYTPNFDTKVEFWWRKSGTVNLNVPILGITYFGVFPYYSNFYVSLNGTPTYFDINDENWHHFQLSMKDGFWMDGVQIATYTGTSTNITNAGPIMINGEEVNVVKNSGDFGMIKIDDNIIIPTEYGFKDLNNNELLEMYRGAGNPSYTFEKIEKPMVLDNLIKQVNVNVPIKAYDVETGVNMSFQKSDITAVPDYINFERKTNWYRCFEQCSKLKDITALRNIKLNNAENVFQHCSSLTDLSVANTWDFSDCTNMSYMFANSGIVDLSVSSYWNTSKVTNMGNLLNASNLVTVGTLDCTSITGPYSNTPLYFSGTKLKNFGGFLNIKSSLENTYASLSRYPDLTHESYINIFNGLYDFTGNGVTPNSNQGKIKIHSNAYDFLTDDDMAIAINKGWTITA